MASNVLKQLLVRFGADFTGLDKDLDKLQDKLQATGDKLTGIGKELSLKLTAPLVAVGGLALKSAADMEQLEVAFGVLAGGADRAKELLKDLQAFAAETPFDFPEIAEAGRKLLAFDFSAEEVVDTLRMLGDVAAGSGQPLNDLVYLFGTARQQGQLFTNDINQLTNRGIPILKELAAQFGVTEGEVRKLASEGKVHFENLRMAFESLAGEGGKYAGMMQAQSDTLLGVWSSLGDNVGITLKHLGDSINETFNLQGVLEKLDGLAQKVSAFAEQNPDTTGLIVAFGSVGAAIGPVTLGLGQIISLIRKLDPKVLSITATLGPLGLAIGAIGAAVTLLIANWEEVSAWFDQHLPGLSNFLESTASGIATKLSSAWTSIKDSLLSAWGGVEQATRELVEVIREEWPKIKPILQPVADFVGDYLVRTFEILLTTVRNVFNTAVDVVTTAVRLFSGQILLVTSLLRGDWEGALNAAGTIWDATWRFVASTTLRAVDLILSALNQIFWFIPGFSETIDAAREKIAGMIDSLAVKSAAKETEDALQGVAEQSDKTTTSSDELATSTKSVAGAMGGAAAASEEQRKKLEAIEGIYAKLADDTEQLKNRQYVLGSGFNMAAEEVRYLQRAMISLLNEGVSPSDARFRQLADRLEQARFEAHAMIKEVDALPPAFVNLQGELERTDQKLRITSDRLRTISDEDFQNLKDELAQPPPGGFFSSLSRDFEQFRSNLQSAFLGDGGALAAFNQVGQALTGPGGLGTTLMGVLSASGPWGMALATSMQLLEQWGVDVDGFLSDFAKQFTDLFADLDRLGKGTLQGDSQEAFDEFFGALIKAALEGGVTDASAIREGIWDMLGDSMIKRDPDLMRRWKDTIDTLIQRIIAAWLVDPEGGNRPAPPAPHDGVVSVPGAGGGGKTTGPAPFALGGIVMPRSMGTLARLAEAGRPEAVIPLDSRGMQFLRQAIGTGRMGDVVVQIDGREIARASIPHMPGELRMAGIVE